MNNSFNLRGIFSLLTVFIIAVLTANSQVVDFPQLDGFKLEKNYPVYTQDDLWDYINGGADSYNSLGFSDLHIAEYTKGKKVSVKVELYRHLNENLAFGIYALERAPSYNFISIGIQGYSDERMINFLKGSCYVKISTHSKSKKAHKAVDILAEKMEQIIDGSSVFPAILSDFPTQGKADNEEMYIAENVIGHEFLSNAFRVNYIIDDQRFVIYLFTEDTPGIISEMVQKYLARLNLDSETVIDGKYAFKDGYNGDIFLELKGDKMVLITGLGNDQSGIAEKYINEILK
ncbi:MAG: hypothetical protein K8R35_03050 [Bacteroidales bacterium]|nr:hypothetical protein [Bacteroidales bacterium]